MGLPQLGRELVSSKRSAGDQHERAEPMHEPAGQQFRDGILDNRACVRVLDRTAGVDAHHLVDMREAGMQADQDVEDRRRRVLRRGHPRPARSALVMHGRSILRV